MSTITISQLPNSGVLTGTESVPVVQNNQTVQTTTQAIANLGGGIMAEGAGSGSTVRINNNNIASGCYSTVAGGGGCISGGCGGPTPNKSLGNFSTIGGGMSNTANGFAPTIAGGRLNTSGVVGRVVNTYDSFYSGSTLDGTFTSISPSSTLSTSGSGATFTISFISGVLNTISIQNNGSDYIEGDLLTFDGDLFGGTVGVDNVVLNINVGFTQYTTVGGGINNITSGDRSTIGGGSSNTASGYTSTIGGGYRNTTSGYQSTVGGGSYNTASGTCSTVGGGKCSVAGGIYSTISGGGFNTANGNQSTVGGGTSNTTSGYRSTVGGGYYNIASSRYSTISGGTFNVASGCNSTVSGGGKQFLGNRAEGNYSIVGGGFGNVASGYLSSILGGRNNITGNCNCAMIVGSNIQADRECTTFVNNLSIKDIPTSDSGLPSGAVWRNGCVLNIVI